MRPTDAMRLVAEDLNLEGDPQRNLATFVTTWMEPEAQRIIAENLHRNFIDHAEYPISAEIEQRCVRMLADLFHAPGETTGCRTQGSSEAIMLGALSLKWKWKERREADRSTDRPNLVFGGDVHVVWEKFCRYFDVEPRIVPLEKDKYTIGPERRGAPPRREHDRGGGRPRHHVHRPHGRHPRDQPAAPRHQEPSRPGHPPARGRRQRRVRLALPPPRLAVGLRVGAGPVDQRVRTQVRARLPRDRVAGLPGEVRPRRGPGLLRELPRQDRRDLHAQLLDRRSHGSRAVLQLRPPRTGRLHLRDEADAAERARPGSEPARERPVRGDRRRTSSSSRWWPSG